MAGRGGFALSTAPRRRRQKNSVCQLHFFILTLFALQRMQAGISRGISQAAYACVKIDYEVLHAAECNSIERSRSPPLRRARSVQTLLLEEGLVPALFLVWASKLLQLNKSVCFHRRNVAMCAVPAVRHAGRGLGHG